MVYHSGCKASFAMDVEQLHVVLQAFPLVARIVKINASWLGTEKEKKIQDEL